MADVSGLVITALSLSFKVASTLYSYGKEVKGARRDIQSLSNELFGLIGLLEHLKSQNEQSRANESGLVEPPGYSEFPLPLDLADKQERNTVMRTCDSPNLQSVLNQTLEFLEELRQSLVEPKRRFQATIKLMKWPLREGEMQKHLMRLERVKTYFVLSLVTGEVDQSRQAANELLALRTIVHNSAQRQELAESRKRYEEILNWLSPVNPNPTRKTLAKSRTRGTGAWFTNSKVFQNWSDPASTSSSTFWLSGITGAGKSTLMTAAIEKLSLASQIRDNLAYFYCSFSNDQSLHTQNVLGSILAQLATIAEPVYKELESLYVTSRGKAMGRPTQLETAVLTDLITKHVQHKDRAYFLIDGINECGSPGELLNALKTIQTSTNNVRIFLSSINENDIAEHLRAMSNLHVETLSPTDIRGDVALLVDSSLKSHPRLIQLPPNLKDDIAQTLTVRAEGMFRWVQCQLDLLTRLRTPGAVRKALSSLPPTLDRAYEEMLLRIDGEEDIQLTKQILQILAFSLRPLTLYEVCTILEITPEMPALDEGKRLTHPNDILGICGCLLEYHEKDRRITLAHHSVKTYLTSNLQGKVARFRLDEKEAHRTMATYCLTYLSFDSFSLDTSLLPYHIHSLYGEFCFLDYAAQQWPLHVREVGDINEPLWSLLRSFLFSSDHGRQNFVTWVHLLVPHIDFPKATPPLYYASSFGLTLVVHKLLELGADVELRGGRGGATPINIAAFRGHLEVVKLLLEHGANPLVGDSALKLNAIQWAGRNTHWHVLRYFESMGYPVDAAAPQDYIRNLFSSVKQEDINKARLVDSSVYK